MRCPLAAALPRMFPITERSRTFAEEFPRIRKKVLAGTVHPFKIAADHAVGRYDTLTSDEPFADTCTPVGFPAASFALTRPPNWPVSQLVFRGAKAPCRIPLAALLEWCRSRRWGQQSGQ